MVTANDTYVTVRNCKATMCRSNFFFLFWRKEWDPKSEDTLRLSQSRYPATIEDSNGRKKYTLHVFVVIKLTGWARWRCGKRVATYERLSWQARYEITSSWHPRYLRISPRTAAPIVIPGERRERTTRVEEEEGTMERVPRVRDTRERAFSLVTVTCDALARRSIHSRSTLRSVRRVRRVSISREIGRERNDGVRGKRGTNNREMPQAGRPVDVRATITLECQDRAA